MGGPHLSVLLLAVGGACQGALRPHAAAPRPLPGGVEVGVLQSQVPQGAPQASVVGCDLHPQSAVLQQRKGCWTEDCSCAAPLLACKLMAVVVRQLRLVLCQGTGCPTAGMQAGLAAAPAAKFHTWPASGTAGKRTGQPPRLLKLMLGIQHHLENSTRGSKAMTAVKSAFLASDSISKCMARTVQCAAQVYRSKAFTTCSVLYLHPPAVPQYQLLSTGNLLCAAQVNKSHSLKMCRLTCRCIERKIHHVQAYLPKACLQHVQAHLQARQDKRFGLGHFLQHPVAQDQGVPQLQGLEQAHSSTCSTVVELVYKGWSLAGRPSAHTETPALAHGRKSPMLAHCSNTGSPA